jgi:hypothetical protein
MFSVGEEMRATNAVIGLWMFVSTFFWFHTRFQRLNAWVVGILAMSAALAVGRGRGWGRSLNALLGAWLIISGLLPLGQRPSIVWNQVVCGFFLVLFATADSLRALRAQSGHP